MAGLRQVYSAYDRSMPEYPPSSRITSYLRLARGLATGLATGLVIGLAMGLVWPGCSSSAAPSARAPDMPAQPSAPALVGRLLRDQPNPKAPLELSQHFGRLIGTWQCNGANRQPDGTWKDNPAPALWTWFYTLDGNAIQDVWESSAQAGGGIGTNLRVFDSESQIWNIVWATTGQRDLAFFSATSQDGDLVMTGDQPARKPFPAHSARITFHSVTEASFAWKYEASAPGTTQWAEFSRLECVRDQSRRVAGR